MISREVYVFLAMIICGGALAVVFDMLRAMRMVLNPSAVIVSASDILFWIFAAYVISAAAWNFNSGIFRFYEPLGIILGAVFYFLLFSKWILKLFLFIFENILKFAKFIFKIFLTPPKFLYIILIVSIIFVKEHQKGLKIALLVFLVGGMIFKGLMQIPQINASKAEVAKLTNQIEYEQERQKEIEELKGKVNTDEYIEKMASEKLGLIKSNAKVFVDVSGEQQ